MRGKYEPSPGHTREEAVLSDRCSLSEEEDLLFYKESLSLLSSLLSLFLSPSPSSLFGGREAAKYRSGLFVTTAARRHFDTFLSAKCLGAPLLSPALLRKLQLHCLEERARKEGGREREKKGVYFSSSATKRLPWLPLAVLFCSLSPSLSLSSLSLSSLSHSSLSPLSFLSLSLSHQKLVLRSRFCH